MEENLNSFKRHRIRYSISNPCLTKKDVKHLKICHKLGKKTSSDTSLNEQAPKNVHEKLLEPLNKLRKKLKKPRIKPAEEFTQSPSVCVVKNISEIERNKKLALDNKIERLTQDCEEARIVMSHTVQRLCSQQPNLNVLEQKASQLEANAMALQLDAKVTRKKFHKRYKRPLQVISLVLIVLFAAILIIIFINCYK
jgi:hypothetical protein